MTTIRKLFSVRTRLLAEVAKWAYPQEDRPHIARVLFDGLHMVATDGHRMVVAPCPTERAPFCIDRVDCALLAAAQRELTKSRDAELTFVAMSEGKATVELDPARVVSFKIRDASDFPPWETLLKGARAETPHPPEYIFNPQYLEAIRAVIEADEYGRGVTVKAWSAIDDRGYCGPMMFESASGIRFLIMAMRAA